ncbi:mechanosensitive ion channel family protein [Rhodohalobacter sp. 614A]|uniref:mechanosensitive ion channel family protein n=1 Tax=Rhodohalobacter sp. 614A TaxID=2908649 RepID=UPI001F26FB50|nr:mechanosensitive ion channel family protein [Rhodohalobacter sp. 614A]
MESFLSQNFIGNTVQEYLLVLGAIILGIFIVKVFKRFVLKRIEKWIGETENDIDDYVFESFDRFVIPIIYFSIIYAAVMTLSLSNYVSNAIQAAYIVILTYFSVRLVSSIVLLALRKYVRRQENGEEKVKQLGGVMLIINIIIWALGFVFLFDNLGYDVTAIITGLGIGGIAIALAAQNILGDLFNYFVIFFDRPFEIGDFLIIDDKNGIVDKIGIKTTRIRTLSGEQLVFANADLTNSRIHNYKKMQRRRIVFSVGVTYETPADKLRQIPGVLKEIVETQDIVDFDRAHFKTFGDSSLNFEICYYINSADFNTYMDIQQDYNFQIYERFEKMGVDIAFPTRTIYVRNENGQKFELDLKAENGDSKEEEVSSSSDSPVE